MYITLKSIKRSLGFKGLEIHDFLIAIPFFVLFLIFFCFTNFKIQSLSIIIIILFLLLPINVSNKNRMYKILILIMNFLTRRKEYILFNEYKGEFFWNKKKKK